MPIKLPPPKKGGPDKPTSMFTSGAGVDCIDTPEQPKEADWGGSWRNKDDGFLYQHAIMPHPTGKTHKARIERQVDDTGKLIHSGLFWEGTEEDFYLAFRKE